jgi:hypothetical protein
MAEPGNFDIMLHRNVTKTINFNLKDSGGAAFDLTGYTVTADAVGAILPAGRLELNPSITDDSGGVITITLSKTITGNLVSTDGSSPGEIPEWDMLIDLSGTTTKIIEGKVYIKETVTT